MGTDKAFVVVRGRPMVRRVADALSAGGCSTVVCQGGDATRLAQLGLDVVPDDEPGRGPVPAIATARRRWSGTIVIAACDLAHLTADVVARLVAEADRTGSVTVAASGRRRHLLSVWPGSATVEEAVEEAAELDSYRLLLDRVGAHAVAVDDRFLQNVNRPEDVTPGLTTRVPTRRDTGDSLPHR
jgi:molybdopterin-guanine dinucleotide biosynthesis protein A